MVDHGDDRAQYCDPIAFAQARERQHLGRVEGTRRLTRAHDDLRPRRAKRPTMQEITTAAERQKAHSTSWSRKGTVLLRYRF